MKASEKKLILDICRIVLGAVFVFSGLMKCIDTWGTAQKVGDYLNAFGMEWLTGLKAVLGIVLSAFELTMGLMLVFGVGRRLISLVAFVFMIGFTLLTLVVAVWDPLDDCGCFGEAVRISNWNSFFKNIVLLVLSIVVWRSNRTGKFFAFSAKEIWLTALFAVISLGTGIVVYRHLPPVDLFVFKKGTDLRTEALCTACMDKGVTLIYKDKQTGELKEFGLEDTEWYDTERWEYVDTRSAYDQVDPDRLDEDFALYSGEYNLADEIVSYGGRTVLAVIHDPASVLAKCMERLGEYLAGQGDARIVVVMERKDRLLAPVSYRIAGMECPVMAMEPKALGYLLRADAGVVTIEDGVITGKKNCRDL